METMETERRTSYRLVLRDSLAQAVHSASGETVEVRVLNSAGGALVRAPAARQRLHDPTFRFQLEGHAGFAAKVALLGPAAEAKGQGLVAFRFQGITGEALGILSSFLCRQHAQASNRLERLFTSRDAILEIAGAVPARQARDGSASLSLLRYHLTRPDGRFFLYDETADVSVPLLLPRLGERNGHVALLATLPEPAAQALDPGEEYVVFCPDALAVTWFRSRVVRLGPTEVSIEAPAMVSQGGFRYSRRVPPPWGHPVTATIENPHLHGQKLSRLVCEIAGDGFAIDFDPTHDRLFPGQQLRHVRVELPSGAVEMKCILRMCRSDAKTGKTTAGFEIGGFRSARDHDRWMRAMIPCLFPQAKIGDDQAVADAWTRLERSGYLELIESSERTRLRTPFFEDWTRQANHPGLRARFVLSYRDGEPIGVTAANLIYPKTCLVHSGGIDKAVQRTGQVLDLYSAAFLFAHSMADYCLSMFDAEKRTNAVLFQRFIQQYSTPSDNVFDRFAVFKRHACSGALRVPPGPERGFDIVSASGALMRVLWEHQQNTLSPLELDAYGFSPDGQCMEQFSERCAADGYPRRRQVFFALRDGVPAAALIAETGSEGMNVFSLLNACSIVTLACPVEERAAMQRSLLTRALDYYGGAGKETFLFLDFGGGPHLQPDDLGFAFVAEGWRWLAAKRVIPAYITYLRDLATLRAARPRSQDEGTQGTPPAQRSYATAVELPARPGSPTRRSIRDSLLLPDLGGRPC